MGDLQHFCLRWNNYQSSITTAFENLRDDEDFVDVTLACEGKSLKAHRVVLSACSPYFRELLKSTPCKHPVIVLQDVVFEDLHALVEFIYHGEVNVHQQSLPSFLKTAEVLRVSGLTQQAEASAFGSAGAGTGPAGGGGGGGDEREREQPLRERSSHHHHRSSSHRGERHATERDRERERGGERERERERGERERPASAGDANDINQENSSGGGHTTKRAKSSNPADSQQQQLTTNHSSVTPDRDTKGGGVASNALRLDATGADCEEPPVDFSTNNNNNKNHHHHHHSQQQQHHHHLLADLPSPLSELVKSEPMDLGCGGNNGGGSGDCNDADSIGSSGGAGDGGDVGGAMSDTTTQDRDDGGGGGGGGGGSLMTSHPAAYLDSKLFAAATGASFNFSMAAALAADSLAGLNNHSHVSGADLAGTSQGAENEAQQLLPLLHLCNECGIQCETALQLRKHKYAAHRTATELELHRTTGSASYRSSTLGQHRTVASASATLGQYRTTGSVTASELHRTTGSVTSGLHHRTTAGSASSYRTGSASSSAGGKFRCDVCGKVYSTMNSLRNHRSIYHRRSLAQSRQVMMEQQQPM